MKNLKIAFMASGNGSNMQAVIDSIKSGSLEASVVAVISNNSASGALARAKSESIPHYHISSSTHPGAEADAIINVLETHKADLLCLAGYMKKVDDKVIDFMDGKVLNIHPALLPKHGGKNMYGMKVHEAVIAAGEKQSGATVHLVESEYDKGRILLQAEVPVETNDTPESLATRVLNLEHEMYSDALILIQQGIIEL